MAKLTKDFVEKIKPSEKDQFFWDDRLTRFGLRVKPSGVKSFLIQYRNSRSQSKRKTIGRFGGPLTVEQAYKSARKTLAAVTLGADPVEERNAARRAWTVTQLYKHYMEEAEAGNILTRQRMPKSVSTLATDDGRIKRHILPLIGSRHVVDLRRTDIQKLFGDIKAGRTAINVETDKLRGRSIVVGGEGTAKRTVGLLSGILTYAVDTEIIQANPARGVRLPKDKKRTISNLSEKYEALGRVLDAAERRMEPWQAVAIIRLVALTGMRRSEAVRLRWKEVDFDGRCLRLENSKTGISVRPIGRPAVNLLRGVRNREEIGDYAFPATRIEGTSFGGLPRAWNRIISSIELSNDTRESLSDLSLHGLRHGFATIADALRLTLPNQHAAKITKNIIRAGMSGIYN